jgi:hypothetical protein
MAYALALTKFLKEKHKLKVLQAYLVISQPSGSVKESYRDALFPASVFPQWETQIQMAIVDASVIGATATPGPHCKRSFCEAGKHGVCPEFEKYKEGKDAEKTEMVQRQAAFATGGTMPVVVESPAISFPIVVISEEAIARANDLLDQAEKGLVLDQDTANQMGLLLNEITKFEGQIEVSKGVAKRPVIDLGKAIEEAAKQALVPLREAKTKAQERLTTWKASEDRKRLQAEIEANRLKVQAESEANAARLKKEAAERQAREATTAEAREKARQEAEKQANIQAAQQQAAKAVQVPVAAPIKIAGVKTKQVPEWEILDFSKMPDTYKAVDEKMLKTAIEAGKVNEKDDWIKITWVDKASSTGRRG